LSSQTRKRKEDPRAAIKVSLKSPKLMNLLETLLMAVDKNIKRTRL
jgi:hypothetical protein